MLAGVLNVQLGNAAEGLLENGLRGRIHRDEMSYPGCVLARRLEYDGLQVALGDIVFHGDIAGQIMVCLAAPDNSLYVLVDRLEHARTMTSNCTVYRHLPGSTCREVWRAEHLTQAIAWCEDGQETTAIRR